MVGKTAAPARGMNDAIKSAYATDLGRVQEQPLDERSLHLRRLIIRAIDKGKRGHIGPALSLVEIIRVLYDDVLRHRPAEPKWPDRDRFILSKGHCAGALYTTLAHAGFIPLDELDTFARPLSRLNGHPNRTKVPGVETNTGRVLDVSTDGQSWG